MIRNIFKKKKLYILIIILGCLLRYNGINNGYWYDEWSSFYYSNPNQNITQIISSVILGEGAQPLYFVIASKWNYLFGYTPEALRYLSFFLGCMSMILFSNLLKKFFQNINYIHFATFLFSTNYFLIQFSQESRWYALSLFFSLLNLIFFFRLLKKKKYIYYYIFTSIISLLTNIFFVLLLFSQVIFLILRKKINYIIPAAISFIIWFIIDLRYISSIFEKDLKAFNISDTINFNFLVGYYFNIYFGGIFLGGLILFFCMLYLKNIRKIINTNIFFLIITIFITYFIPIIYSFLKNPILRPRYIIFIVPIIIIYFCHTLLKFDFKYIKNLIIIIVSTLSLLSNFQSKEIIPKPDTQAAINLITKSNNNFLLIRSEDTLFYNYLVNLSDVKKSINLVDVNQILDKQFFWSICLNNPRFATNSKNDDIICLLNPYSETHKILEIKRVPDYILTLYEKNKL